MALKKERETFGAENSDRKRIKNGLKRASEVVKKI